MLDFLDDEDSFRGRMSDKGQQDRGGASRRRRAGSSGSSKRRHGHRNRGNSPSRPSRHSQRAAVKVTSVKLGGRGQKRAAAHAKYLQRDGTSRDDEPAQAYGRDTDDKDLDEFLEQSKDDRHQFRVILSPEFAHDLDLKEYARDWVEQVEKDVGTELEWAAVNHYNTDNPHVHMIIRGADERGQDLFIDRDYLCHGMRHRAQEVASHHLGPRTQTQVQRAYERSIDAERYTQIDKALVREADEKGVVDLRHDRDEHRGDALLSRNLRLRRAQKLQQLGLAKEISKNVWKLDDNMPGELKRLSHKRDIIKRMYAAKRTDPASWHTRNDADAPAVGRLVDRGLADDHNGARYAVLDTPDGKARYVELDAAADTQSMRVGDVVEFTPKDARGGLKAVDPEPLARQIEARGPTWLDKELVTRTTEPASRGFGKELSDALAARRERLQERGLLRADSPAPADLVKRLRSHEREHLEQQLAQQRGKRVVQLDDGDRLTGQLSASVEARGGRYHVLEAKHRVALIPSNQYLRDNENKRVQVSLKSGQDGRIRTFVDPKPQDQGLER